MCVCVAGGAGFDLVWYSFMLLYAVLDGMHFTEQERYVFFSFYV